MNLHEKLRQGTKEQHIKIESVPLFKRVMTANITVEQYQLLLQALYGYIAPCEGLIQSSSYYFLLAERKKMALLESDLLALGMGTHAISELPRCGFLPDLNDYEQMLGFLYVFEGSTLGGQIITKMLKKNLQLRPDYGLLYFHGYGKNTVAKWDDFCKLLNETTEDQDTRIIGSAQLIYATLYDWMLNHEPASERLQHIV